MLVRIKDLWKKRLSKGGMDEKIRKLLKRSTIFTCSCTPQASKFQQNSSKNIFANVAGLFAMFCKISIKFALFRANFDENVSEFDGIRRNFVRDYKKPAAICSNSANFLEFELPFYFQF